MERSTIFKFGKPSISAIEKPWRTVSHIQRVNPWKLTARWQHLWWIRHSTSLMWSGFTSAACTLGERRGDERSHHGLMWNWWHSAAGPYKMKIMIYTYIHIYIYMYSIYVGCSKLWFLKTGWWLVVDLPLWKNCSVRQWGWDDIPYSISLEHQKFHGSSHHQPVMIDGYQWLLVVITNWWLLMVTNGDDWWLLI